MNAPSSTTAHPIAFYTYYQIAPGTAPDDLLNDASCLLASVCRLTDNAAADAKEGGDDLFGIRYLARLAENLVDETLRVLNARSKEAEVDQQHAAAMANLPDTTRRALHKALHALEGRWPRHFNAESQRDHEAINAIREVLAAMGESKPPASGDAAGGAQA